MQTPRAYRILAAAIAVAIALILATFGLAAAFGVLDEETVSAALDAVATEHGRGAAGLLIALLLAVDLFLPLPSSVLMMLSGTLLGAGVGFGVNFVGSLGSAALGYGLCRRYGKPAFEAACGTVEASRVEESLARIGPWLILVTRAAPVLAEVTACVVGLAAMRPSRFLLLAAIGTVPVAAVYAWSGALAREEEVAIPLAVGIVLPVAGFLVASLLLRRRTGS